MEDNKIDWKDKTPVKQSLDVNKWIGSTPLYGQVSPPKPKEYTCPVCGTILAADILWKETENYGQKPFCGNCKNPVTLRSQKSDT